MLARVALTDREKLHVETVEQWHGWLAEHGDRGEGVWLVTWKRATGRPAPSYDELVTEALAQGWVDSTAGTLDAERGMLWFAPRKKGSGWSRPNKQRIELLEAQGRMQPRGRARIEAAKADGSWVLLDDVENLVMPPDLAAALNARPGARATWEGFPRSVKRGQLERLVQAKRPATREKRVREIAEGARRGERAYFPPAARRAGTGSAGGTSAAMPTDAPSLLSEPSERSPR
jgi:uncharacterized protein YdeI (YjbR/CyaY-like superfamily)